MACCIAPNYPSSHSSTADPRFPGLTCRNVTSTSGNAPGISELFRENSPKQDVISSNSERKNRKRKPGTMNNWLPTGVREQVPGSAPKHDGLRKRLVSGEEKTSKIKSRPKHSRKDPKPCIEIETGEETEDEDSSDANEKKYKCPLCKHQFLRPWRLKAHMETHTKTLSFKCDYKGCDKAYSYKQHLERHKSIAHADIVITVSKIKCPAPDCGAVLASSLTLKKHIQRHHDESNFKYPCSECGKKFKKHRQLSLHLMEHTNEPPYRCGICNIGSVTEATLKQHMKHHKEYKCTVSGCKMTFSNFSLLRKHKAEHNTCFSSMKCAHCDKTYSNRSSMVEHVMTHLNEQSNVHQCPYEGCSRVYYQKRNLNHHIRFSHERKTKFMCTWEGCGRPCHNKKKFEMHMNFHTNGKAPSKPRDKPRAKRKDAGQKKRAAAVLLSGFSVPRDIEKELLMNNGLKQDENAEEEERVGMEVNPTSNEADVTTEGMLSCASEEKPNDKQIDEGEDDHTTENISTICHASKDSDFICIPNALSNVKESKGLEAEKLLKDKGDFNIPASHPGLKVYVADAEGCVNDLDIDVTELEIQNSDFQSEQSPSYSSILEIQDDSKQANISNTLSMEPSVFRKDVSSVKTSEEIREVFVCLRSDATNPASINTTYIDLSTKYSTILPLESIMDSSDCNAGGEVLFVMPSCENEQSDTIVFPDRNLFDTSKDIRSMDYNGNESKHNDHSYSLMQCGVEENSFICADPKGSKMNDHPQSDKEELQGPSKEDDDEGNVSEENSGGSQADDSSSDDSDFLPEEEIGDDYSGEDDNGEEDGEDQEDDEEDEDDEQDEEPDDDDEEEDDDDNEAGGANHGEQDQNDDNNNSDNINCDSANESGKQADSNSNDEVFNIGNGSETGVDRSQGPVVVKDKVCPIKEVDTDTDDYNDSGSSSSSENKTVTSEGLERSKTKVNGPAVFGKRYGLKSRQDENSTGKETGKEVPPKGKEVRSKTPVTSTGKDAANTKISNKSPEKKREKKRSPLDSDDSEEIDAVPLAKRVKTEPQTSGKPPSAPTFKLHVPDYKVCSRFSEDTWISTLKKASKVMKWSDVPKD